MARPIRAGVDYFPLDCVMDNKFQLLEAEFGLKGFAVVVKLFQRIYQSEGYYCEFNDDVALLFSKRIGEGRSVVSEIVSKALSREIFDPDLYQKYQILTSMGIQKRYLEITQRRKNVEMISDYLLLPDDIIPDNVNILSLNVCNNPSKCIQEYTKESKGKESKGKDKERMSSPTKKIEKHFYGENQNVLLSDSELEKLKEAFPGDYEKRIEDLSFYIASTGKSYKSHYMTMLNWARMDQQRGKGQPKRANKRLDRSAFMKRDEDSKSTDDWLKQQLARSRKQSLRGDGA